MTSSIVVEKPRNRKSYTNADWISDFVAFHGDTCDYSKTIVAGSNNKIEVRCTVCGHTFFPTPSNHLRGSGCIKCAAKKRALAITFDTAEFIRRAIIEHGDKYSYHCTVYVNSQKKVEIYCNTCCEIFTQLPNGHLQGKGCKKCALVTNGLNHRTPSEEYFERVRVLHENAYGYDKAVYLGSNEKIEIDCRTCGATFWQTAGSHLSGCGCPHCHFANIGDSKRKTQDRLIEQFREKHGDTFTYDVSMYVNDRSKIKVTGNACGHVTWQTFRDHLFGFGCPICSQELDESLGATQIRSVLSDLDIAYATEHSFPGCKGERKLRFDFYLPEFNACIEYQGPQHYSAVPYWGGQKGLIKQQKRDQIKREFCTANKIGLLEVRFDCKDIAATVSQFLGRSQIPLPK